MATITVSRQDNGLASYNYNSETLTTSFLGYWDDTTPWDSGSYTLDYWRLGGTSNAFELSPQPEGRSAILLHAGASTNNSIGCLIAPLSEINKIYADLNANPTFDGKSGPPSGVDLIVQNDFDVRLSLTSSAVVTEGDSISITAALTGAGATNGVSKDVYVRVAATSGSATVGVDVANLATAQGVQTFNGTTDWIKIPAGQVNASISLSTISGDAEEESENLSFSIIDYRIKGGNHVYKGDDNTLLKGVPQAAISGSTQINDLANLVDKTVDASGGVEGYDLTSQFAPGQSINYFFVPYSIPDQLIVSDASGSVLLNTGFVGNGITPNGTFLVPEMSTGLLRIRVNTNDPGTAWTFTLTGSTNNGNEVNSIGQSASLAAVASSIAFSSPLFEAANAQSLEIAEAARFDFVDSVIFSEFIEVADEEAQIVDVDVVLDVKALENGQHTLKWSVVGVSDHPIDANDFAGGVLPSGLIETDFAEGTSKTYIDFGNFASDGVVENFEEFALVVEDLDTGEIVFDIGLLDPSQRFRVYDDGAIDKSAQIFGDDADNLLTGTELADVIISGIGDDSIRALGGDDIIEAGPGADTIDAGAGNDQINPGFGTDDIDGGAGLDILVIPRNSSDVTIDNLPDGRVILTDLSSVPYGEKVVSNIETILFSDDTVFIDSSISQDILGTSGSDNLVGSGSNDVIRSFSGSYDRMTGGGMGDVFVFGNETSNGVRERDVIQDYEVGVDAIRLEDGATIGSIHETSSQVVIFLEGDGDAIYVRGDNVTANNLTIIADDPLAIV